MRSKNKWLKKVITIVLAVGFSIFMAWILFINFISVPVLHTEREVLVYLVKVGIFSIFFSALLCGGYFYIRFLENEVAELSEQLLERRVDALLEQLRK